MTRIKFIRVDYYDGKVVPICFLGNDGEYYCIDRVKSISKAAERFEIVYIVLVKNVIKEIVWKGDDWYLQKEECTDD